jgi:lactoylglutathione lyase
MQYKLYAVRVFVRNFDDAVDFYRNVLGMTSSFCSSEFGWAEFDIGESHLALERVDPADKAMTKLIGRFVGMSLQVDDITAVHEDLSQKGVTFTAPPKTQSWGGSLAHFEDPEGNTLTLLGMPV